MNLIDLVNRKARPTPWEEGDNIPWNEPAFSRRMLKEHLSQEHDAASRRFEIIDRQVEWIHTSLLSSKPSRVLDLGCGPGLYSSRLAKLDHTCFGIDFSPASIEFATAAAKEEHLRCQFICQDIRLADYPADIDLVMLIYGEFNVFRKADATAILAKAYKALKPGGYLLLEPHTFRIVKHLGMQPASWYSSHTGLFHDGPHLVLKEYFWDATSQAATIRYYVLKPSGELLVRYAQSLQAYHSREYRMMITRHGFSQIRFLPGLSPFDPQNGLIAMVAQK